MAVKKAYIVGGIVAMAAAVGFIIYGITRGGKKKKDIDKKLLETPANQIINKPVPTTGELVPETQATVDKMWGDASYVAKDIITSKGDKLAQSQKDTFWGNAIGNITNKAKNFAVNKIDSYTKEESKKRQLVNNSIKGKFPLYIGILINIVQNIFKLPANTSSNYSHTGEDSYLSYEDWMLLKASQRGSMKWPYPFSARRVRDASRVISSVTIPS